MTFNPMLAAWGAITIGAVLIVIIKKWLSPVIALSFIPFICAVLAGMSLKSIGKFSTSGLNSVTSTGTMFIFAVLFFGIMYDNGLFDRAIAFFTERVQKSPIMIFMGLFFVSCLAHLDGSGATTFLIAISAFKPIFDALNLDRRKMICIVALAASTMNNLPWGGPTLRMAAVLKRESDAIPLLFHPAIPAMIAGLVAAAAVTYFIGKSEMRNLDLVKYSALAPQSGQSVPPASSANRAIPWNALICIVILIVLMAGWLPPFLVFAIGLSIILPLNYGFNISKHKEAIDRHAKSAILMASILFAAGIFTGIVNDSGMIKHLSIAVASVIPQTLGKAFDIITAVLGLTAGVAIAPDPFYFGVMPVMVGVGEKFGIDPGFMGRIALVSRNAIWPVSPLSAATYLLIGLGNVDLGDHIRYSYKYLLLPGIISIIVLFLTN